MKLDLIAAKHWNVYQIDKSGYLFTDIYSKQNDENGYNRMLAILYKVAESRKGHREFNTKVIKTVDSQNGIIQIRSGRYRFLCFTEEENFFICGICFLKKSKSEQQKLIKKTIKLKNKFLEEKKNNTLIYE